MALKDELGLKHGYAEPAHEALSHSQHLVDRQERCRAGVSSMWKTIT